MFLSAARGDHLGQAQCARGRTGWPAQPAGHKPWANRQPTNHTRAVTRRAGCTAGRRVSRCACDYFRHWRVSISGLAGPGANASDPPPRPDDVTLNCTPLHNTCGRPRKEEIVGGGGTGIDLMETMVHRCVKTQKRKTMTMTLRSVFRSIGCRN